VTGPGSNAPVEIDVEIDGATLHVGTLWISQRGPSSASFAYTADYLQHPRAYPLESALPLRAGQFHTGPGRTMFNAFGDSTPDRWGQNLMRREERERAAVTGGTPRTLRASDFLLGVRDPVRQGAIRFRDASGEYLSSAPTSVPRLIEMGHLLSAVDRYSSDQGAAPRDIRDLVAAGGSLGGARPKAAVITQDHRLAIAKFPRKGSDDWDVIGWEGVELELAARAGINVARWQMLQILGRNVLVVDRFDRNADSGGRIGFASALTMLDAVEREQRSYLEIGEVIRTVNSSPRSDLRQLFRRIIFSILTSNTDDHLRNHGFLRTRTGWALAPAYDMNPAPEQPDRLSLTVDLYDDTASIETVLSVCADFEYTLDEARDVCRQVEIATRSWAQLGSQRGLTSEVSLMSAAYDNRRRTVARTL
jgi:serine/threonine-protein kinase HipA